MSKNYPENVAQLFECPKCGEEFKTVKEAEEDKPVEYSVLEPVCDCFEKDFRVSIG